MKYLFIGGAVDGKRLEVPDDRDYWVAQNQPKEIDFSIKMDVNIERHFYKKQRWIVDKTTFWFFVWDQLTPTESIRQLIEGYKPDVR